MYYGCLIRVDGELSVKTAKIMSLKNLCEYRFKYSCKPLLVFD